MVVELLVLHVCHPMAAVDLIENLCGAIARLHLRVDTPLVLGECLEGLISVVGIDVSI